MRFGLELFAWSTLCLHGEVAVGETGITLLGIKMQFQRYDRLALATGRHVSLPVNSLDQPSRRLRQWDDGRIYGRILEHLGWV